MSSFAPGAAIVARRQLTQQALEAHYAGCIVIAEIEYPVSVHVGSIEYEQLDDGGGAKLIQRFTCSLRKELLETAPVRQQVLMFQELAFLIGKVEGQSPAEPVWVIHAHRLPKKPGA